MTFIILLIVIYSLCVILKASSNSNKPNRNRKKPNLYLNPLCIIMATQLYRGIRFPARWTACARRLPHTHKQTVGCVICEKEVWLFVSIFSAHLSRPPLCVRSPPSTNACNYTFDDDALRAPTETPSATNACGVRICSGKKSEETKLDNGFASENDVRALPVSELGRCSSRCPRKIISPDNLTGDGGLKYS